MLLLGAVALAGLRPWETDSVGPNLAIAPGLGVALGDSVEVAPAPAPAPGTVADARVAPASPSILAAEPAAAPRPSEGDAAPVLAVSPGRAVATAGFEPDPQPAPAVPAPASPPAPQPIAQAPAPAAEPAPVVATVPVRGAGGAGTPGTAGTPPGGEVEPPQSCEGDEYLITVTFASPEAELEDSPVSILLQRIASDGSESELELEGDLSDARALIDLLSSEEGNCVQVEYLPFDEVESDPEAG